MKTEDLFTEIKTISALEGTEAIFKDSGMLNHCRELSYGFFPLGNGVLTEESITNASDFHTMVLGNDFGTFDYLKSCIDNGCKESPSNPTIRNLLQRLTLDPETTFFTNFHLGVRLAGTNTKRVTKLKTDFKNLCFDFLLTQLRMTNPKIVLCLGHEVRHALIDISPEFSRWAPRNTTLQKLYMENLHYVDSNNEQLGSRRFIIIPHPCDTRNFNDYYIGKILETIEDFN